jgi:septal ring factor EnvC (AmiA/AmiB activator)
MDRVLGVTETIHENLTDRTWAMIIRKATISILLVAGILTGTNQATARQIGTILVSDLRMRSGPGTDYRVVGDLAEGIRVPILGRQDGWLQIEHGGLQGYILDRDDFVVVSGSEAAGSPDVQGGFKDLSPSAENINEQLRQSQSDLDTITRKEKAVLDEFNTTEEALDKGRQQVRGAQAELAELNARIDEIEAQSQDLEKELRTGEAYAAKRVTALYKLNWVGKIHLLATADSFFDFVHRRSALQRILGQDEAFLDALNNDKIALESLLTQLNTKKAEKRSLELTLKDRVSRLNAQQNQRKTLLEKIRGEKTLELAALDALHQAALDLDTAVEHIEPSVRKVEPPVESKIDDKPFDAYKGLLSWPVKGKILSFFGPHRNKKYAVNNFQSGINIQAERGEPIRCVADGYTIFSSWFKGFGNMMIVDHGDHYYTVYAHLEEVFKVKGDRVEKNEVIATVGDSGSMIGPALHFEVRHHGKPIDPMQWIRKG